MKEILYDCAVDVRATKAALYLFDPQETRFSLVTEYGFRGALRTTADNTDPVVDRCGRGRTSFFVNGLMAEPRFSEILYESSTDRMLVAPIYQRGQLVGFVDMRDKAAKQPFDTADLPKAQKIADRVGELFATKNVFGQRFIQLSTASLPDQPALTGAFSAAAMPSASAAQPAAAVMPPPVSSPAPAAVSAAAVAAPPLAAPPLAAPAAPMPPGRFVPKTGAIIQEASAVQQTLLNPSTETLAEGDIVVAREMLRLILLIPGVVAASFAAAGHLGGIHEIAGKAAMADDAAATLQSKLDTWLQKREEPATFARKTVTTPFGPGSRQIFASDVQKVFTAPLAVTGLRGLYLTVAFAAEPDRSAHDLLAALHRQLQFSIEQSLERRASVMSRRKIAERLLEPDFTKFPELRKHTELVVARVDAFVKHLGLSPAEIENARILAIVHDVGMRLLDYDRLYRKRDLSHDEKELLQSHVIVGAALVEPFLGREVARAVLCHHERWDGGGYPNDLRGAQIPLLSRVLQICDVYESMTASDYQPAQPPEHALSVISRGAGIQFDPELAGRFAEMMRAGK